ncbi:MAG TPA: hypothetical protein VIN08_19940 [Ohtaekwangia sp.]|uniref:hypothetical protein n=1 Tax=Ohtaekwangia sp. TaxID=2066019 RepID=UPI002F92C034
MDEKISLEAIALYGDTYAENVLKGFFSSRDRISGPEILNLCNVQQVNLFVVRELFRAWKEETKKLKSAYFDYENPDVKEALENFMGVLSKNISIDRAHFAPLLKKASSHTLLAIFDPYDFFSMVVTGKNNKLEVEPFREEIKYLKVNKAPLERMLQKLDEKGAKELSGNEAFAILDQILEEVNFTPEDVEEYIEKFSAVVPLDPARFYVSKSPQVKPPVQEVRQPEPPRVNTTLPPKQQPPVQQNRPNHNTPVQQGSSLNDRMGREAKPMLAGNFKKIMKIKDSLTINQKFMFTKVLFHGDFELFSKAIDRLDQLDNVQTALQYIDEEYASTWDRDSEEFHEFMELVEKRFA